MFAKSGTYKKIQSAQQSIYQREGTCYTLASSLVSVDSTSPLNGWGGRILFHVKLIHLGIRY